GRVLDETLEGAVEAATVAVEDGIDVEAEIGEQAVDGARIAGGVRERRQRVVGRLADDQRHAAQRLFRTRGGGDRERREQSAEGEEQAPRKKTHRPNPMSPEASFNAAMAARW